MSHTVDAAAVEPESSLPSIVGGGGGGARRVHHGATGAGGDGPYFTRRHTHSGLKMGSARRWAITPCGRPPFHSTSLETIHHPSIPNSYCIPATDHRRSFCQTRPCLVAISVHGSGPSVTQRKPPRSEGHGSERPVPVDCAPSVRFLLDGASDSSAGRLHTDKEEPIESSSCPRKETQRAPAGSASRPRTEYSQEASAVQRPCSVRLYPDPPRKRAGNGATVGVHYDHSNVLEQGERMVAYACADNSPQTPQPLTNVECALRLRDATNNTTGKRLPACRAPPSANPVAGHLPPSSAASWRLRGRPGPRRASTSGGGPSSPFWRQPLLRRSRSSLSDA